MYEKVNPSHPDKQADRIAGALVDIAYSKNFNPKVAIEVLLGHGKCHIINETDTHLSKRDVKAVVRRITQNKKIKVDYVEVPQDTHLAQNQAERIRCGDNGIFKGMPITREQDRLTRIAFKIYENYPSDGKYIIDDRHLIICQSQAQESQLKKFFPDAYINPLGYWVGGSDVDSGATNRKLGSDMGDAVTGGGLHGKDLSKADVSVNIYVHLKAQKLGKPYSCCCAIGDGKVDNKPYSEIVEIARKYINEIGGFEKFAEWGLLR